MHVSFLQTLMIVRQTSVTMVEDVKMASMTSTALVLLVTVARTAVLVRHRFTYSIFVKNKVKIQIFLVDKALHRYG
jgi:hypothetical protein